MWASSRRSARTTTERGLRRETLAAVEVLPRERGIPLAEIVVLSARGHGRSLLLKEASWALSALWLSGRYTADGEPVWSRASSESSSRHRFKGQSAMGVVLAEVDFDQLDEAARRRLFVGMTRAQCWVGGGGVEAREPPRRLAVGRSFVDRRGIGLRTPAECQTSSTVSLPLSSVPFRHSSLPRMSGSRGQFRGRERSLQPCPPRGSSGHTPRSSGRNCFGEAPGLEVLAIRFAGFSLSEV